MEIGSSSRKECLFKVLLPGFKERLQIPDAFVKHFSVGSSRTTTIQGHGGTWCVKVNRSTTGLYFEEGWENLPRDLSLTIGEVLVFRYDGDMNFSVKVLVVLDVTENEPDFMSLVRMQSLCMLASY